MAGSEWGDRPCLGGCGAIRFGRPVPAPWTCGGCEKTVRVVLDRLRDQAVAKAEEAGLALSALALADAADAIERELLGEVRGG